MNRERPPENSDTRRCPTKTKAPVLQDIQDRRNEAGVDVPATHLARPHLLGSCNQSPGIQSLRAEAVGSVSGGRV